MCICIYVHACILHACWCGIMHIGVICLQLCNISELSIRPDLNKAVDTNIINKYVPHFFTSSRHNLPWFTKNLNKLCKRKQRLYNKAKKTRNQDDWQEFCDIRKNVHEQLRSARVSHISQFLTTSITDKPKSFWTFISKLRQDNQGIGDLHVSGSIVSADGLKAEALNEQFNSVYTEEGSIPLPNMGESP